MLFAVIEMGSLGMARKSAQDLAEAKAFATDSVVATYKLDPATGIAVIDPKTGLPVPDTYVASRYTPDRVKARRTHYEDHHKADQHPGEPTMPDAQDSGASDCSDNWAETQRLDECDGIDARNRNQSAPR